jgi:hypothetical protein
MRKTAFSLVTLAALAICLNLASAQNMPGGKGAGGGSPPAGVGGASGGRVPSPMISGALNANTWPRSTASARASFNANIGQQHPTIGSARER